MDFGSFKVPIGKGHTAESVDSVQNTADLPQTLFRNILVNRLGATLTPNVMSHFDVHI